MNRLKIGLKFLLGVPLLLPFVAHAQTQTFPQARIQSVSQGPLSGPIHHGLTVQTEGIEDPNLSYYEVQLKPNSSGPFPPWRIYNTKIQPYDGMAINLPYRNGIFAMQTNVDYCVRIRSVYGLAVTPWAQSCGIRFPNPTGNREDTDGDGVSDVQEFALGTDPRSPDSDGDTLPDGTEVANGSDPNQVLYPNLIIRSSTIDFGASNPFGQSPNQHQVLEIENQGDSPARINSIRVVDGVVLGSAEPFHLGPYPDTLTQVPPQNILRLPISFLPTKRGRVSAQIEIASNNPTRVPRIVVSGVGIGIPDCLITPTELDFGTVAVNDPAVLTREVTIANQPEEGDWGPPNSDTDFSFTLTTTIEGMAPTLRVFTLAPGEDITIPVFFQHPTVGEVDGHLEIRSAYCGTQQVRLRGNVTQ